MLTTPGSRRPRPARAAGRRWWRSRARCGRTANIYVTIIIVSLLTAPLAVACGPHAARASRSNADGRLYLVLIHLALGGFLFHFMTLPDRSVTLRILVEVLLAPGQALSAEALGEPVRREDDDHLAARAAVGGPVHRDLRATGASP